MEKTKFDLLFEDIANKLNITVPSPYDETVEEYVHEYIRHDFKVVIVKVTDDTGTFFEFMLGKIDKDGNLIDWPYFESSNEFETVDEAINAAEDYIYDYAKYLGLEPDKIIDEFNEYLFEYTSKIPMEDIEKAMKEQQKEEIPEKKIVSPYTTSTKKSNTKLTTVLLIALGVLVALIVIWSVRQIAVDNMTTNIVSYVDSYNEE